MPRRQAIWSKLAGQWRLDTLAGLYDTVSLEALERRMDAMLRGESKGRTVVALED